MTDSAKRYDWPMYAIAFDLDNATLEATYGGPSWQNAYEKVRAVLKRWGFVPQQGSVYFGMEANQVDAVLAVQELAKTYPWFAPSVKDIQILQILTQSDLRPAIDAVVES